MKEKNDLNPKSSDKEQNENELGVEKPSNESKLVKDTDNKFYSLSEIDLLHGIFDPEGEDISQLRFRDILMSERSYGSVVNDRNYVIKKKEIKSPDEAIADINMSGWSHGESFESDRTANYKGVCKVLTDIMLDPEQPFNYGHPYMLEELAERVKKVSPYSAKPWTIARRMSDLRLCYIRYSIVYFKGKVERDGKIIKENFFIMANNGQGNSGIFRKSDMKNYQDDYKWLDWFDNKEEIDNEIDTKEDE